MQCRICHSEQQHPLYTAKEMMLGLRDTHVYFQCKQCQCLQIRSIPDDLAGYYPDAYYSYNTPQQHTGLRQTLIQLRDQYAVSKRSLPGRVLSLVMPNKKLETLRPLALKKESALLDVGCGAGLLLHSLQNLGFKHLLGIDPFNNEDIQYANGLQIKKQDLFSTEGEGTWDVIMFHHSFEHLPEQQATLKQAHKLLKPDGKVLLRVPTVSSYAWQHYGVNWVQLDAPRHLFLHSQDSISSLAEQTGFTLKNTLYDSNAFQFWGSEQYEKDIPLNAPESWSQNNAANLFTAGQIKNFEKRARELNTLNQGDQAAFYLHKS